jgi:Family of unknown function (DUF6866) N-terminal domain/Family of unknown function (DUF6866) C-terminal domain
VTPKDKSVVDLDVLSRQVLENCAISDARFAGHYSVCGLALRLRDLYKWEKGLEPWVEQDPPVLLEWIGGKQEEWEGLVERDFVALSVSGTVYDPFDVAGINGVLEGEGLFYGAGYVHSLKPSFFLARLEEVRDVDGYRVYILGRELARDLVTAPALSQEERVLVRKEAAQLFLWNQIFFLRKSGRDALAVAMRACGLEKNASKDAGATVTALAAAEMESYIHHELGEIRDRTFDRQVWRDIIAAFPHTPVELLARTVKDMLADTNEYGRLQYIAREEKTASLALYVAFLDGLRKELFPEVNEAFREFLKTGKWRLIEDARVRGYGTARYHAEVLTRLYRQGAERHDMAWAQKQMEEQLLVPLGILREQSTAED